MRESISMTTVFQIVILFILLFTGIMCLTINNANAFAIKDEIVNIIELNDGNYLENGALNEEIVSAIQSASYRATGKCDDGYTGYDKDGREVSTKASICIKEVDVTGGINSFLSGRGFEFADEDFADGVYYRIQVFYQLDLPVVNQLYTLDSKGETRIIYKNKG